MQRKQAMKAAADEIIESEDDDDEEEFFRRDILPADSKKPSTIESFMNVSKQHLQRGFG